MLIVIGGLAFNIGNIAGGGPSLNALLTGVFAIILFPIKKTGRVMDVALFVLGIAMIVMILVVAFISQPPIGDALRQTFVPDTINFATITTIVGGYITY